MSSIEVKGLSKSWGEIEAVKNVSFVVPEKSFTVLLGPSGCGKSTILKMLSGLESVTSGSIKIENRDVINLEASKRGVSMVFQSYALFPHLNVKENIQFGLKVRKVPAAEREKRVAEAANAVGLSDLLDRKPSNLSGGPHCRDFGFISSNLERSLNSIEVNENIDASDHQPVILTFSWFLF